MEISLALPTSAALHAIGSHPFELAEALAIDSPAMLEVAGAELITIKKTRNDLDEKRKKITGPLDTAKKEIMDLFRPPIEFLDRAEAMLKTKIGAYQNEQKRIAAEAQRKLDEEATKERNRLAAEAAVIAAKAREAEEKLRAEAEAAKAAGNAEMAAKLKAEADAKAEASEVESAALEMQVAMTVAPIIAASSQKVAGISGRDKWEADVIDKAALLTFIANNFKYLDLVDINQSALNRLAGVMKAEMDIPGTKVRCETVISARSGK